MADAQFAGFPEASFAFLKDIAAHNDKAWFERHRAEYEAYYVEIAKTFVMTMGPRLEAISPGVRFAPRINGSISRINRDVRFSKDKRPYKDHIDLWFWHGETRSWACPGFFLRLTAETVLLGTGMHVFPKDMLQRYRQRVSDAAGAEEIKDIIAGVAGSGPYQIGGQTRTRVPRGYSADGASGEMLLYDSLTAVLEWDNGVAHDAAFLDFCQGHWQKCWPIGKWMLDTLWSASDPH